MAGTVHRARGHPHLSAPAVHVALDEAIVGFGDLLCSSQISIIYHLPEETDRQGRDRLQKTFQRGRIYKFHGTKS
jgi:hypothetical protein